MPKCPKCGAEVDCLINIQDVWEEFRFWIDEDGDVNYEDMDSWDGDLNEFKCPSCSEVLFEDEGEAEAFLKGEE